MISLKESFKLAFNKLKIRRVRTLVSVLAASVLFGVVAFLMISSNVFLDSIFAFHTNFFADGKIYIKVDYSGEDFEREVLAYKGSLTKAETYNQSYGESQSHLSVKDHPESASVGIIEIIDDDKMLSRFKLAEPIYNEAIPVFVSDRTAAALTGVDIVNTKELQQEATNFIYTAEDDENNKLDFEIIGLFPTTRENSTLKNDYYNKISGFFAMKYNQDMPIVRRTDLDRIQPYYKSLDVQFGVNFSSNSAYISFNSYEDAREFTNKYLCVGIGMCNQDQENNGIYGFGNELVTSQLAIADFKIVFNKVIFWLAVIFMIISAIILLGTFSRVFLDEQKTAAIFEAIGATRFDIWKIYFFYALILGFFVMIFTQIIGYFGAFIFDLFKAESANQGIMDAFKITTSDFRLTMFGVYCPTLWVSAAAFLAVIISFALSARHISSKNIIQKLKD